MSIFFRSRNFITFNIYFMQNIAAMKLWFYFDLQKKNCSQVNMDCKIDIHIKN